MSFIATLDKRTSSTCRQHDNNIYPIADAEVGTNVPPLHPRCRSTIAGTLDKKATSGSRTGKIEKANKSEPTRYEKVPSNMDYDDWKAVYVDGTKTLTEWRRELKPLTITSNSNEITIRKARDLINVEMGQKS